VTASLYPRIGHDLKPRGARMKGVTSFLTQGGPLSYLTFR
jgi:hypothetical protein